MFFEVILDFNGVDWNLTFTGGFCSGVVSV